MLQLQADSAYGYIDSQLSIDIKEGQKPTVMSDIQLSEQTASAIMVHADTFDRIERVD